MEQSTEIDIRQSLIAELKGLQHNFYKNSPEYHMILYVLHETKRIECETTELLYKYAVFLSDIGISVTDLIS